MERHVGGAPPPHHRGRSFSGTETAHANEYFEHFLNAATLKNILGYHRSMCELLHLKPNVFPQFYPKLRSSLTSWKAKALWKKFDSRISHKCYGKGKACHGTRVLVIGAGPCGLRTAIEAQLLGAKVVVVEKRDRLSRNNVLHLWPFVIEDLRMLGAKKFFGKFCAGAIDHISIRQLQCILLKVALLLGVEIHTEVSFERLREPDLSEKIGWRAEVLPNDHPVAQYEFDVIVGADGKRNTLQGFKRKEFRGKLAIAITANFINKKSEAEARVEEISGVAFIFNQKFFKDLQAETRIDLENIVYYKDDTHYFVMTAKKASLLEKGVIKQDLNDTEKLLAAENVDRDALQNYAREAADFSTNYQLPELEFAVNHYGQPDVAMFDFTSMYAAEYASKVIERHGTRLLTILVGDSLLEPFWPTGSGCARGFLSSLDAAWAIRSYCSGQMTALDVLAERESIYRLLAQTTPDNLNKDWKAYTLDPATRYPNLNKSVVTPLQTVCLYDTDAPEMIEKMKRASLDSLTRHEHTSKKRRRGTVDVKVVLRWLSEQLRAYDDVTVTDLISVFRPGKALCALLHHYRPDLLDYAHVVNNNEPAQRNQLAMEILEKELGVAPFMTGDELTNSDDFLTLTAFLTQLYDTFRGEIPHVKHPKLILPPNESIRRNQMSDVYASGFKEADAKRLRKRFRKRSEAVNLVKNEFFDFTYQESASRNRTGCHVDKLKKVKSRNVSVNVNLIKPPCEMEKKKKKKKRKQCQLSAISETLNDERAHVTERKDACVSPGRSTRPFRCETFVHDCPEPRHLPSATELVCADSDICQADVISKTTLQRQRRTGASAKSDNVASINIRIVQKSRGRDDRVTCQQIQWRSSTNELIVADVSFLDVHHQRTRPWNEPHDAQVTPAHRPLIARLTAVKPSNRSDGHFAVGGSLRAAKRSFLGGIGRQLKMARGHDDIYDRVQNWISKHDFKEDRDSETGVTWDVSSDLTSITRSLNATTRGAEYAGVKVEQRTDVINCAEAEFRCQSSSNEELAELVKALKQQGNVGAGACATKKPLSKFNLMKSVSAPPANFSVIVEGEESELPESQKRSEFSFKTIKTSSQANNQTSRPSSRHKRNVADVANVQKAPSSLDRKQRKRRTFERIAGPSVIYSRWFLPLMETLFVGILLLTFDVYVNPEQYREKPAITSFLDQFWTQ